EASFYSRELSRRDLKDRPGGPFMEQSSSLRLFGRVFLVAILALVAVWILRPRLPALAWAGVLALATWPPREWLIRLCITKSRGGLSLPLLVRIRTLWSLSGGAGWRARHAPVGVQPVCQSWEIGLGPTAWAGQFPSPGAYSAGWWPGNLPDSSPAQ